jgi:hypothetical protein
MTKLFIATDYDDMDEDDVIDDQTLSSGATELEAVESFTKLVKRTPKFVYEIVNKKQVTTQTPRYSFVSE